jgi:hypothetical protein
MAWSEWVTAAVLLHIATRVLAHGHEEDGKMDMDMGMTKPNIPPVLDPLDPENMATYAGLDQHRGAILLHITFMVLAWFFVLPIGKLWYFNCLRSH